MVSTDVYQASSGAKTLSSSSTGDSTTSLRLPHVLTRSAVKSLVTDLDASDVLECYYLTRHTQLQGSNITITKAALGLRHRLMSSSTAASSPTRRKKRPLALTLEYGPARAAFNLQQESVPSIDETRSFVSWENEAKIYYTQQISSDDYPTANYLASVSGAALGSLLISAVDYTERHRRYQPFTVVDEEQVVLGHSNSDVDFLLFLYQQLATLGVSLQPVLVPAHFQVRVHASIVKKVQIGQDVQVTDIAIFYSKFASCIHAIATADYTQYYAPSTVPSVAPSKLPDDTPRRWLAAPSSADTNDLIGNGNTTGTAQTPEIQDAADSDNATAATTKISTFAPSSSNIVSVTPSAAPSRTPTTQPSTSFEPTISTAPTLSAPPTNIPTPSPLDPQAEAQQAAAQAQQAANDAQQAGNQDAAQAAQAAATAAQHAADLTASQQAAIHQDWLLQGEGHAVASAVSLCFTDDLYGLQGGVNDTTVKAYLYWDGSFYLQLDLVPPFVSVVPLSVTLPQPEHGSALTTGKGDFVDWSLAFLIAGLFGVGCLLLLQQVLGRNLRVIRPLYKFQQWLFDPLHYYEMQHQQQQQDEGGSLSSSQRGLVEEREYTFGEDVIPLSMGGRKAPFPLRRILSRDKGRPGIPVPLKSSTVKTSTDGIWGQGDVELTRMRRRTNSSNDPLAYAASDESDDGSLGGEDGVLVVLDDEAPTRLFRDPDLVDLPDLKSRTKVAVPVSMSTAGSSHSMDEGY